MLAIALGSLASHVIRAGRFRGAQAGMRGAEEAATLPLAFLTACYGLERLARASAGEPLLIHAAAGGVGQAAVQLARRLALGVLATASPGKWEFLKSQGVEHVFNSRTVEFAEQVAECTGGRGVDVVLNSLNGEFIPASLKALGTGGRFVEIGKLGIWTAEQMAAERPDVKYLAFDLGEEERREPGLTEDLLGELQSRLEHSESRRFLARCSRWSRRWKRSARWRKAGTGAKW